MSAYDVAEFLNVIECPLMMFTNTKTPPAWPRFAISATFHITPRFTTLANHYNFSMPKFLLLLFCFVLYLHLPAQQRKANSGSEIIFDPDDQPAIDSSVIPPPPPPSLDEMMNTIFTSVQEYPRFTKQGRREDLSDYLYEHRTYPNTGDAQKKNGTVYVRFIVGSDGTVREPVIVSGMGSPYDEEALRIINALPKFYKPARLFDMDVNCYLGAHVYFYPE